jgi:putative ABC transport system permease protein
MELLRYLANSLLRRPVRTAFIAAAGALSAAVLVFAFGLGARSAQSVRDDTIAKWTGHLWVSPKDDFEFKEEDMPRYRQQAAAVRDILSASPEVTALVPWRMAPGEIQAGTARSYALLTATDFDLDEPYRKTTELVAGRFPGGADDYGVLVTTVIADKYKLKPGSSITVFINSVFGARNAMDFVVTGIVRASAPWYDQGITVRMQDWLSMTELGDASPFYKAYVRDETKIPALVSALKARVPDFPVKGYRDDSFVRFLLGLGTSNVLLFGFVAMIIFLALLVGIRSVILTSIFDRRDEIGTLRALGFPRGTVRALFFGEALVSLFAGYLVGTAAVAVIGAVFQARVVRPPLLMLQYMFGMTRMGLTLNAAALLVPFLLLFLVLFVTTFRTVGRETEKQAAAQMAGR